MKEKMKSLWANTAARCVLALALTAILVLVLRPVLGKLFPNEFILNVDGEQGVFSEAAIAQIKEKIDPQGEFYVEAVNITSNQPMSTTISFWEKSSDTKGRMWYVTYDKQTNRPGEYMLYYAGKINLGEQENPKLTLSEMFSLLEGIQPRLNEIFGAVPGTLEDGEFFNITNYRYEQLSEEPVEIPEISPELTYIEVGEKITVTTGKPQESDPKATLYIYKITLVDDQNSDKELAAILLLK